jgi:hypothetical protein
VKQSRFRVDTVTEMTTAVVISALHQVPETNLATLTAASAVLGHSR